MNCSSADFNVLIDVSDFGSTENLCKHIARRTTFMINRSLKVKAKCLEFFMHQFVDMCNGIPEMRRKGLMRAFVFNADTLRPQIHAQLIPDAHNLDWPRKPERNRSRVDLRASQFRRDGLDHLRGHGGRRRGSRQQRGAQKNQVRENLLHGTQFSRVVGNVRNPSGESPAGKLRPTRPLALSPPASRPTARGAPHAPGECASAARSVPARDSPAARWRRPSPPPAAPAGGPVRGPCRRW